MNWKKKLYHLFADFGDWLIERAKDKDNAILLGILSIFSPLGFIFAISFIAASNRKKKK